MVQQSTLTLTNIKINRTTVLSVLYTFNCLEQCNSGISARFKHHRSCNKPYLSSYLSVWMSDVLPFVFHIRENECADLNETFYSFYTTWWYFKDTITETKIRMKIMLFLRIYLVLGITWKICKQTKTTAFTPKPTLNPKYVTIFCRLWYIKLRGIKNIEFGEK